MKAKSELKKLFENGDIPSQEQFWDWMDSYWHKEESIDLSALYYSNPEPAKYGVGGVAAGTTFHEVPLSDLLDQVFYGKQQRTLTITTSPEDATVTINGTAGSTAEVDDNSTVSYTVERAGYHSRTATVTVVADMTVHVALEPDLSSTEIRFRVRTTKAGERVPIVLLRTSETQTLAGINYGDGEEELVSVPVFNGTQSWTDNEGNVHYIDNGNTFYHVFGAAGDYDVTVRAGANVSHVRFCESLTADSSGYMSPTVNNYVQEISRFSSDSITNLDYTFAGLSQANVPAFFQLETPGVRTMNATFYGFGIGREFDSFPAAMLAQVTKPTVLRGTFFRAGLKRILPGFLDSFSELVSVFECFKYSKLGKGYYGGLTAGNYIPMAVQGTNDFIPVSLFWKNPKLTDISHVFNYIGEGWFGNLTSGYLAFLTVRRELFWNGKSSGNLGGTIKKAFYAFAKCNRVICEPNLLKHAAEMVHIGGLFTQTNHTSHAVSWGGMIPVAANETQVYQFSDSGGNYTAVPVNGKGLTFDLNVMFPDAGYPNILTLNGAFTASANGATFGFNHRIDYTGNGMPAKLEQPLNGAAFLAKFPNAVAGSVDGTAKMMLGQTGGSSGDKNDGRHGVFYLLDQDERITDRASLPAVLFNNAIPY